MSFHSTTQLFIDSIEADPKHENAEWSRAWISVLRHLFCSQRSTNYMVTSLKSVSGLGRLDLEKLLPGPNAHPRIVLIVRWEHPKQWLKDMTASDRRLLQQIEEAFQRQPLARDVVFWIQAFGQHWRYGRVSAAERLTSVVASIEWQSTIGGAEAYFHFQDLVSAVQRM